MKFSSRLALTAILMAALPTFGCAKIKHLLHRDGTDASTAAADASPVAVPTTPSVAATDAAAPAQPSVAATDASVPAVPTPPTQQVLVADAGSLPVAVPTAPVAPTAPVDPTPTAPLVAAPEPGDGHHHRGHRNFCKDHPGRINPETGAPCPLQGL